MSERNNRNYETSNVNSNEIYNGAQPEQGKNGKSGKRSALAAMMACVVLSGAAGFGGGLAASKLSVGDEYGSAIASQASGGE